MSDAHELQPDECLRLLRSGVVGRIAINTPSGPHIVPVNHTVVDDMIVFRTTPYSVLGTYGRDTLMAFEVDHVDYEYGQGWSVLARGRAAAITDSQELAAITPDETPHPWAGGSRNLYIGLRWTELSGRRLGGPIDWRRDVPVNHQIPIGRLAAER